MLKIALVVAMEKEAAPIINGLGLQPFKPERYKNFQFQFYRGVVHERIEVMLIIPGLDPRFKMDSIGTEPAAVCAFAVVTEFQPDLLINAGTCGSFASAGAELSKVYLSRAAFYFHDHRIPIAGWREFGLGGYPSVDVSAVADRLNLETANVSSGNSLDYTDQEIATMKANGAILKEMEAGGIAWVAAVTGTPFFAIKSVTNLIDTSPDSPSEFEKNFARSVETLSEKVLVVFKDLAARDAKSELGL